MAKEVVMANLKNKFNLPQAIGRLNPLPVDADYVKDTYDLAASFATSDPTAYVGQLIYAKDREITFSFDMYNPSGSALSNLYLNTQVS